MCSGIWPEDDNEAGERGEDEEAAAVGAAKDAFAFARDDGGPADL